SKFKKYKRLKSIKKVLIKYGISCSIIEHYNLIKEIDSLLTSTTKISEKQVLSYMSNLLANKIRNTYNSALNSMKKKYPKEVKDFEPINNMNLQILLQETFMFNNLEISIEVATTVFELLKILDFNYKLFNNSIEIQYGLNILNSTNSFKNYLVCIADISNKISPSEFINKLNYKVEACKTLKENI
ncbi:hypothetical protein C4D27_17325, partial [Clostridium perfringens]